MSENRTDEVGHAAREPSGRGLSLEPFAGLRPTVDGPALAARLCPPYDVIDADRRRSLLSRDAANAVAVILPEPTEAGYADAARRLEGWVADGVLTADSAPALYVYEMRDADANVTRGLLGAVELRDPADGVILPHENTMAGPVADRLAVMTATGTDLEPIYLVYDGGGEASELVARVDEPGSRHRLVAEATTEDGIRHRLWRIDDPAAHDLVDRDLGSRHALIADGHHRYATYRERQRTARAEGRGDGPWDRGLALLVDTTEYGPQVHPIHRTITGLTLGDARARLPAGSAVTPMATPGAGLEALGAVTGTFAAVLSDGTSTMLVLDADGALAAASQRPAQDPVLSDLDVTVLHRGLVERVWQLPDDVNTVGYAHDVDEALAAAHRAGGFAVLLRPTPVDAVAAVAAAGARMPRKSTLFTPKPASGLVMRRLRDQGRSALA